MPVSFSKSSLLVSSACDTGLLLARKVTVLPWNFFQSKSAALAAVVTAPNATTVTATRVANAFPDMCFLPVASYRVWFGQISYVNRLQTTRRLCSCQERGQYCL